MCWGATLHKHKRARAPDRSARLHPHRTASAATAWTSTTCSRGRGGCSSPWAPGPPHHYLPSHILMLTGSSSRSNSSRCSTFTYTGHGGGKQLEAWMPLSEPPVRRRPRPHGCAVHSLLASPLPGAGSRHQTHGAVLTGGTPIQRGKQLGDVGVSAQEQVQDLEMLVRVGQLLATAVRRSCAALAEAGLLLAAAGGNTEDTVCGERRWAAARRMQAQQEQDGSNGWWCMWWRW